MISRVPTIYLKIIANPILAPRLQANLVVGPIKPKNIPALRAAIKPNIFTVIIDIFF